MQLMDGSRRMIDLTLDEMVGDNQEVEVQLVDLGDSNTLPEIEGAPHWSTDVDHLNERLEELKRE